jgi:short-subunit dehydrogenase
MNAKARPLALITGASGGIGEQLAYRFAEGGYDLALVARSADRLAEVAENAELRGARCHILIQDLTAPDAGAALDGAVTAQGLQVDVLVNNAGYGLTGGFLDNDRDEQLAMIDLDVRILTELCHRFGTGMKARGRGGILNVASTAAFQPGPWMAVYYASKAYVLSFTEALNRELKGTGVHATCLCPGPVLTDFQARANFDDTIRLNKAVTPMGADVVSRAGYEGFRARKGVVIPGAANFLMAKSVGLTPRPVLLAMVDMLQRKGAPA